jgi:serine/threonine-protein kinase HipA
MSVEVHIEWEGTTLPVGRLYPAGRGQSVSFEYSAGWLAGKSAFAIDPTSMPLQRGMLHSSVLFGALQDCGPDRWGRILIERAVRKGLLEQRPFQEIDYVLALDDHSRIGALRFRRGTDPTFLAQGKGKLPPVVQLPSLLRATEAIHSETETAKDLRFLLGQGSPLGGARPKSAVTLADGELGIAKFPKPDDVRDIAAGESLALSLARASGICTPDHQLVSISSRAVAVIRRFDRENGRRIPFVSAASLLGLPVGEAGSYTMLADAIRQFGDDVSGDLRELWRRMVFSLLASNYDDHLRNHGFLMHRSGRWSLSPAYDINPVPEIERASINKTSISEDGAEPSIEAAIKASPRFGLKADESVRLLREMLPVVRNWRKLGQRLHLNASQLNAYASAFENEFVKEAQALV